VIGRAKGEVDPRDTRHKSIALIDKAAAQCQRKGRIRADIFILRPKDPGAATGDPLRGQQPRRKMLSRNIADGPQGVNDPKTVATGR